MGSAQLEARQVSHQALLKLEGGSDGPAVQLFEAAKISGVDLAVDADDIATFEVSQQESRRPWSAPKEEWALRWLMKKTKPLDASGKSYRLHSQSWVLFRKMIFRIPPQSLITILHENKLLDILKTTFDDLNTARKEANLSSSTAMGNARKVQNAPEKRGKKRKRQSEPEGAQNVQGEQSVSTDSFPLSEGLLMVSILRFITALISLPSRGHQIQVSGLKSKVRLTLRSNVQTAAFIIGSAYRHAVHAISSWAENENSDSISQLLQLLPSVHTIWDCRTDRSASDSNALSSNDGFATSILPESLALLLQLREHSLHTQFPRLCEILEGTIALFFVLPLRDTFHAKLATVTDAKEKKFDQHLFLFNEFSSRLRDREPHLQIEFLPVLLDVFARAVPRDTFKKESQEGPWLETVFITLAARCGCPPVPAPAWDNTPTDVSILCNLLDIAITRRIRISLPILCEYAKRYSGLFSEHDAVNWNLMANLLRVSVDIVLPNSGLGASKILLTRLVASITGVWLQSEHIDSQTHHIIKNEIVIPLLRGFSNARDLSTFVQLWTDQLQQIQEARKKNAALLQLSTWEDEDVLAAYSDIMRTEPVSQTMERLDDLFSHLNQPTHGYSSAILLDAILPVISAESSATDGNKYLSLLLAALDQELPYLWRLWRLACHFMERSSYTVNFDSQLLDNFLVAGAQLLEDTIQDSLIVRSPSSNHLLAPTHAFKFLVLTVSQDFMGSHVNVFESYIRRLAALMPSLTILDDKKSQQEDVSNVTSFILDLLTIILANPVSFAKISSESRSSLLSATLALSRASDSEIHEKFEEIQRCFISPDWLAAVPSVVPDVVAVVLSHLETGNALDCSVVDMLSSMPAAFIPPHQRVRLLDLLQKRLSLQQNIDGQVAILTLSFMTRLVELPKSSTSQIVSDPTGTWDIAKNLPNSSTCTSLHSAFHNFFMAVLDRVSLLSETKRLEVLRRLASLTLETPAVQFTSQLTSILFFTTTLTLGTLTSPQYEGFLESELLSNRLRSLETDLQSVLSDSLASLYSSSKSATLTKADLDTLGGVLACLQVFDEFHADKKVYKLIQKFDDPRKVMGLDASYVPALKRCRIHFQKIDMEGMAGLLKSCFSMLPAGKLQSEEARRTFHELHRRLSLLEQSQICELLIQIFQEPPDSCNMSNVCLVAGLLFSVLRPVEERDGVVYSTVSPLFSDLCRFLPRSATPETFSMIAENLDYLLHFHTRCLTQWNIDNLLAAVCIALGASGMPQLRNAASPGLLYQRICRILAMLFGQYRQKLSGRMHIVVILMQQLLCCLFIYELRPGAAGVSRAKHKKMTSALPPWITAHDECEISQEPEYAISYTRLLTLLCDPTVSAVQRHAGSRSLSHTSSSKLTDNTKKVKSLAGQHLQYVILEYTVCSLRGRLLPSVKAALVPGLYAILNVMNQEGLRGLNASMDGSTRAVFRGLYDDYKRFGRWDQG
ncbi:hypothetical protein KEM54_004231 [Ascosphaera aggregata]|nr:hypothetical protein KEM54_004231 [Ascosphaera aggregata]